MKQEMKCKVVSQNGMMAIDINGEIYPPLSFKTFRPTERNISDFSQAGVKLINILSSGISCSLGIPYSLYGDSWIDDETYDFDVIDRQIDFFIEKAPDAYFSLMITLDTRDWWLKKREGYPDSFKSLAQMEADPAWRELAAKYLQAVLEHVEKKYENRFYGYFLLCGGTTEWLSEESLEEPTVLVEEAFRKWMNDETVTVPDKSRREANNGVFLGEADQDLIHYRTFENWQRADSILYFAAKAQEVLKHNKLVGVYFGYIFELAGPRLWNTAHLDYERIFLSEDIDMIASPVSYASRGQNCGSQPMITNATLALHNKICFYEHDQTTCIVPDYIEGKYFVHPNKVKTIEADMNLLRRDYMFTMADGCATWWFDMFGGWFYDQRFMDEIGHMTEITAQLMNLGCRSVSEVAVFVDPQSMYYVSKNAGLNDMLLGRQRMEFSYMGVPYDLYSVCDAENVDPDQYKLCIFLTQFQKNEAVERMVASLKEKGKTVMFVYAYHLLTENGFDLSYMSKSLGMEMEQNPEKEECIVLGDGSESSAGKPFQCFSIREKEDVEILGRYKNSGKAAFAYKKEGDAIVAFAGLGNLSAKTLKSILSLAGVHQYTKDTGAILYINESMIGIYHLDEKIVELSLTKDGTYVDLFNEEQEYASENGQMNVPYAGAKAKMLVRKS